MALNPRAAEWRPGGWAAAVAGRPAGGGGDDDGPAAAARQPTAAPTTTAGRSWAAAAAAAAVRTPTTPAEAITSARGTPTASAPVAMRSAGRGRARLAVAQGGAPAAAAPLRPSAARPTSASSGGGGGHGGDDLTFDDLFHASASDVDDVPGGGGGGDGCPHTPTRSSTSSHPGAGTTTAGSASYAGPSPSPSRAAAVAEAEAALASLRLAAVGGSASVIASPLVTDAAALGEAGGAPAEAKPPSPPAARVEVAVAATAKEKEAEEKGGGEAAAAAAAPGDEPGGPSRAKEAAAAADAADATAAAAGPALPPVSALGRPPPCPAASASSSSRLSTRVGPDDFTLLRVVGKGAFGKVFQVRQRGTGAVYAMKVMRKAPILAKGQGAYVRAERDVLTSVVHPYIVTLRYSFQTEAKLYLVLDFVAGGHLFFQLYRQGIFSEDLARLYTAEIVLAVAHLHGLGFVHRDLKPENVLLDAAGHVKVTDFGLAKAGLAHDEGGRAANSFIGTVEYMAPEVVAGRGHGKAVDWWSVGILLYEMLCGVPPFRAKGRAALQRQILGGKLKLPPYLSREAQALLRALLVREPPKRLGYGPTGSADVMGHAFFSRVDWAALAEGRVASPFRPSLRQHDSVENFDRIWTDLAPEDSPVGTPREGGGGGPPPPPPTGDAPPHTPPGAAFDGFTYIAPGLVEEAWAKAAAAAAAAAAAEAEGDGDGDGGS